jgi:hypothetical protein
MFEVVVPWYVVTSPQVLPGQHWLPALHEIPCCLQHAPDLQSSPTPWQHCEEVVHWKGWPVPEFSGSRQAPQVCAPAAPMQPSPSDEQQIVVPLPATQEVPAPEQQVPCTPGVVDVQIPLLHSCPSRQDQSSFRLASL